MAVIDGKLDLVVSRDKLLEAIDRSGGPRYVFTEETLADGIHAAYCEPRGFGGLKGEIHRRQHIEQARMIIEAKGARS